MRAAPDTECSGARGNIINIADDTQPLRSVQTRVNMRLQWMRAVRSSAVAAGLPPRKCAVNTTAAGRWGAFANPEQLLREALRSALHDPNNSAPMF
eukprot:COSAG05_NODE_6098_length_1022_cov_1.537378_1_plen_96_part_00